MDIRQKIVVGIVLLVIGGTVLGETGGPGEDALDKRGD